MSKLIQIHMKTRFHFKTLYIITSVFNRFIYTETLENTKTMLLCLLCKL